MKKKESQNIRSDSFKYDVSRNCKYIINSIKEDIKENFFYDWNWIWEKEIDDMLKKDRKANIETIKYELIDKKLLQLMHIVENSHPIYTNSLFLLKQINKILKNLEQYNNNILEWKKDENLNKPLRSIFVTEEDENRFYELVEGYMYEWYEKTLKIAKENPSKYFIDWMEKRKLRQKQEAEKKEKERLELERQKEEKNRLQEKEAIEFIEWLKESTTKEILLASESIDYADINDIMDTFWFTEKQAKLLMDTFGIEIKEKNPINKNKKNKLITQEEIDLFLKRSKN